MSWFETPSWLGSAIQGKLRHSGTVYSADKSAETNIATANINADTQKYSTDTNAETQRNSLAWDTSKTMVNVATSLLTNKDAKLLDKAFGYGILINYLPQYLGSSWDTFLNVDTRGNDLISIIKNLFTSNSAQQSEVSTPAIPKEVNWNTSTTSDSLSREKGYISPEAEELNKKLTTSSARVSNSGKRVRAVPPDKSKF